MRKSIIFICIMSLFILSAFKGTKEQSTAPQSETKQASVDNSSKKELVWLVHDRLLHGNGVDKDIYKAFNKMLLEKGADYTVQFVGFDPMNSEAYQKKLLDMQREGRQLDLFMGGFGNEEMDTGIESVKNNLLEPLEPYLQTEQGQKLYDQFDEKIWDRVKINQTIYGLNNNSEIYYPTAIFINEKVAKSMGVEIPKKTLTLDQLEELLQQADVKSNKKVVPFAFAGTDLRGITGNNFLESGLAANYNADGIPYVFNPFEESDVIALLETFERLAEANYWKNDQASIEKVRKGQFLSYITTVNPLTYVDGTLYQFDKPIKAKSYPLSDDFIIPMMNDLTGIASWSANKAEAFDLLTRINTDSDLSNLLYYGIEEDHYTLEKGIVKYLKDPQKLPGYDSPANRLLTHPENNEPKDKEKVIREWLATAKNSPMMGFELDSTKIEEELADIQEIYEEYDDIWLVDGIDVDDELKEVNAQLEKAEIDRVVEEINRQLLNWWEAK